MKKLCTSCFVLCAVCLLLSCTSGKTHSTSKRVKVLRPPVVDLHGADVVSVLPVRSGLDTMDDFDKGVTNVIKVLDFVVTGASLENSEEDVAILLEGYLQGAFSTSEHFTYIDSKQVKTALASGKKAPCQLYAAGYLQNFNSDYDYSVHVSGDLDAKKERKYRRVASVSLVLQLIDAATNKELYRITEYIEDESPWESSKFLVMSTEELLKAEVLSVVKDFVISLQPHYVYVYE